MHSYQSIDGTHLKKILSVGLFWLVFGTAGPILTEISLVVFYNKMQILFMNPEIKEHKTIVSYRLIYLIVSNN